jgi:hypothetical protein
VCRVDHTSAGPVNVVVETLLPDWLLRGDYTSQR